MSNKVLKLTPKDVSEIDSYQRLRQQIEWIKIMDQKNPKALNRAGNIGKEVREMFLLFDRFKIAKENRYD